MSAYYNENDPQMAAWLRELIQQKLIATGEVDERSIEDVRPDDLRGFRQCHFFAGIGGWSYALRLAGWPDDEPVWTGSCPCQPFSSAGKGAGFDDERHLWPAWHYLIAQCRPAIIFGEQVASKAADAWIDLVHADMEGVGYAFGCVPFPAAGVGAPHIRDRNYWVAHAHDARLERWRGMPQRAAQCASGPSGVVSGLADAESERRHGGKNPTEQNGWIGPQTGGTTRIERPGSPDSFWANADWLGCTDGKWRPVEPGLEPLAYGVPARMVRLRGFGNAIVPPQAAAFIQAYRDCVA